MMSLLELLRTFFYPCLVQAKLDVENYRDPQTTTPPPVPMTNPSYVPVFNSSGFQIPPRMLNDSQLQTWDMQLVGRTWDCGALYLCGKSIEAHTSSTFVLQ